MPTHKIANDFIRKYNKELKIGGYSGLRIKEKLNLIEKKVNQLKAENVKLIAEDWNNTKSSYKIGMEANIKKRQQGDSTKKSTKKDIFDKLEAELKEKPKVKRKIKKKIKRIFKYERTSPTRNTGDKKGSDLLKLSTNERANFNAVIKNTNKNFKFDKKIPTKFISEEGKVQNTSDLQIISIDATSETSFNIFYVTREDPKIKQRFFTGITGSV